MLQENRIEEIQGIRICSAKSKNIKEDEETIIEWNDTTWCLVAKVPSRCLKHVYMYIYLKYIWLKNMSFFLILVLHRFCFCWNLRSVSGTDDQIEPHFPHRCGIKVFCERRWKEPQCLYVIFAIFVGVVCEKGFHSLDFGISKYQHRISWDILVTSEFYRNIYLT